MRSFRIIVAIAAAATITTGSIGTAVAARPTNPFTGTWTGTDDLGPDPDFSTVMLTVGTGPAPSVLLEDDGASVCGLPFEAGRFEGRGRYDRRTGVLIVNFTRNTCDNGTRVGPLRGLEYVFDGDHIVGAGATYLPE